jgi:predicted transcriptional regulator
MINQAQSIRCFIVNNIEAHPNDIVALVAKKFKVSRTTVHRHINMLVKQGKLIKSGTTTNVSYCLTNSLSQTHTYKNSSRLSESAVYQNDFEKIFSTFPTNVEDICHYGFTEIFNNAIDHSRASTIKASTNLIANSLTITIEDNGIGIFEKISQYLMLEDIRESVLHLTKGKLTTDPANHTGEGIFFSSRVFDIFEIYANGIHYYRDNLENDWGIELSDKKLAGTIVSMTISISSEANLVSAFKEYQDSNSQDFNRTEILVELSRLGQETLISRSQAKRVLMGLEKFNLITLDFSGVRLVGQGFVDEVFRVFQQAYPEKKINFINANDEVEFMIQRSI